MIEGVGGAVDGVDIVMGSSISSLFSAVGAGGGGCVVLSEEVPKSS